MPSAALVGGKPPFWICSNMQHGTGGAVSIACSLNGSGHGTGTRAPIGRWPRSRPVADSRPQTRHSVCPLRPPPTFASRSTTRAFSRGEIRTPCLSVGSYRLAIARAFMHSFRGKLRAVTSVGITLPVFGSRGSFRTKEVSVQGKASSLSPGVLIRPAPCSSAPCAVAQLEVSRKSGRLRGAP